jgi:hypothetical protein
LAGEKMMLPSHFLSLCPPYLDSGWGHIATGMSSHTEKGEGVTTYRREA